VNKLQIRTKVRRKLDETSEGFWLDDELDDYINESYFSLWQMMLNAKHQGCLTSTTLNITGGSANVALPADFQAARLIEKVVDSGTVPLWWEERFDQTNYTAGVSTGSFFPFKVRFVGQNLIIEPTPQDSETGGLKLTYYFFPNRLDDDTDEPNAGLHDFYQDLITYEAVLIAKAKEEMVGGGGADLGAWGMLMEKKKSDFKGTIELPSVTRQAVEPFELGD
jgi:hypothetical protein